MIIYIISSTQKWDSPGNVPCIHELNCILLSSPQAETEKQSTGIKVCLSGPVYMEKSCLGRVEGSLTWPSYLGRVKFKNIFCKTLAQLEGSPFCDGRVSSWLHQLFYFLTLWFTQPWKLSQGETIRACTTLLAQANRWFLHTCPLVLITIKWRRPIVLNRLKTRGTGVQGYTI